MSAPDSSESGSVGAERCGAVVGTHTSIYHVFCTLDEGHDGDCVSRPSQVGDSTPPADPMDGGLAKCKKCGWTLHPMSFADHNCEPHEVTDTDGNVVLIGGGHPEERVPALSTPTDDSDQAKGDVPEWRIKITRVVRSELRRIAPCQSHKHDGVHSDYSCWKCGGSLIEPNRAQRVQTALGELFAVMENDDD